jgi:hypothetical protein
LGSILFRGGMGMNEEYEGFIDMTDERPDIIKREEDWI